MYAQMVKTGVDHIQSKEEMSPEERAFQDRVDADIKIEPKECRRNRAYGACAKRIMETTALDILLRATFRESVARR